MEENVYFENESDEVDYSEAISKADPPCRERLLDFFSKTPGCQFAIPIYQRYYTWTFKGGKRSIAKLLDDIENIANKKYKKHFLGILIYYIKGITAGKREYQIIDGQQRLVTVFLILHAFMKVMEEKNVDAKKIKSFKNKFFYLNPDDEDGINRELKLKPQVTDDNVYKKIISDYYSDDDIEPEEKNTNIYRGYQYIYSRVKTLVDKYGVKKIGQSLYQLYIVYIPVSTDDHPQKIFESINSTGEDLKASDLIRNFILMPVKNDLQDTFYKNYWSKIEKYAPSGSDEVELFFRNFLAAKNRELPDINNVFEVFVDWFNNEISLYDRQDVGIQSILEEIVRYARCYYDIRYEKENLLDDNIKGPILEFRGCYSAMPLPLFMEFYYSTKYPQSSEITILSSEFGQIVDLTNTYLMRRWLADVGTNKITTLFPQILKDVCNYLKNNPDKNVVDVYKKYLVNENKGKSSAMPTDQDLRGQILEANMYSKRTYVMAFFKKYENFGNTTPAEFKDASIEHLMPQTSTPAWIQEAEMDDQDEYIRYLHMLGNLTVGTPSQQAQASNHLWEYKNEIMRNNGHLKLNMKLLGLKSWTKTDIINRTKELIEEIINMYPYFESKLPPDYVPIFMRNDEIYVRAIYSIVDATVRVYKESTLCDIFTDQPLYTTSVDVIAHRNQLRLNKITGIRKGRLVFKNDYTFTSFESLSALDLSASIILDKDANGLNDWFVEGESNLTLKEYLNQIHVYNR